MSVINKTKYGRISLSVLSVSFLIFFFSEVIMEDIYYELFYILCVSHIYSEKNPRINELCHAVTLISVCHRVLVFTK